MTPRTRKPKAKVRRKWKEPYVGYTQHQFDEMGKDGVIRRKYGWVAVLDEKQYKCMVRLIRKLEK